MPYARRTEAAQHDLESIAFQIAVRDHRPLVADRIIDELIEQTDKLAKLSSVSVLGTPAPEIGRDVRLFPCKRWVILFRYVPHGIDVLRIADGSQDYLSWKLVD
jgi:plasmid stabilization system protein ParE